MVNVFVTKGAVDEMVAEVLRHPDIETAWGLCGLILPSGDVIVAGVLKPSEGDIVRQYTNTKLGGPKQAEAVKWLRANRKFAAERWGPDIWDSSRFAFLFKGHSHHGLGVDSYSGTDHASILEAVEVDGLEVAIGPLATLESSGPKINSFARWRGTIAVDQHDRVYLRFYYLSKEMVEKKRRRAILIDPIIIDTKDIPLLPPLGWQFTQEEDYMEQLRHLKAYGATVEVVQREIKDGPPYEIQFLVRKPNWRGMLSIVTSWDHPKKEPEFRVIPLDGRKATEKDDYKGADHLLSGKVWRFGEDFIEVVFRLEARGEL